MAEESVMTAVDAADAVAKPAIHDDAAGAARGRAGARIAGMSGNHDVNDARAALAKGAAAAGAGVSKSGNHVPKFARFLSNTTGNASAAEDAAQSTKTTDDANAAKRPVFRLSRNFFNRLRKRDDHPLPEPVQAFLASPAGKVLVRVGRGLRTAWKHRPRFSYAFYVLVFIAVTFTSLFFLQRSAYLDVTYADPNAVDAMTKAMESPIGRVTSFFTQSWLGETPNKVVWVNAAALALIYLAVVLVINRFWVATALFGSSTTALSVATHIKLGLRNEPVLPSDLSFVSSGNAGDIWSFIPSNQVALVNLAITGLAWYVGICVALQFIDRRTCLIPCSWRHPMRSVRTIAGNCGRVLAAALSVATVVSFTWNLSVPGAWSYEWSKSMGDIPYLWDTSGDARANGTALGFLRLAHVKTMDKPEGYSKATMEKLAQRYATAAEKTNRTRAADMTDSTVIMVLSESLSDPTRVPGITFSQDPMPNIRATKTATTGGLMLSPGYGGGTANIEYQSLTGMSLAMFDNSLQSPYQELVPHQKTAYTFNQIWNARYGEEGSIAFHPYYKNMYLRDSDYKKFGFDKFVTLDSKPAITHQDRVPNAPEVSDASSYQNVLDALNDGTDHARFIQLVTMQNHMPYNDWYPDNEFKALNTSTGISDVERTSVDTYTKGVNLTDAATADFLNQLNQLPKPVTVIFYGDHLPGIYDHAANDSDNTLALHETDYFIWSNQASSSAGVKLSDDKAAYTSSNFFMSLAAEHMDAKVSPYLEMLDEVRAQVPAMGRLALNAGGFDENASATYLSADGHPLDTDTMTDEEKQLLADYRLVQYDLTAGKGYLQDTDFLKVG